MSLATTQMAVVAVTFLFLLIQLALRRGVSKSSELPAKLNKLEILKDHIQKQIDDQKDTSLHQTGEKYEKPQLENMSDGFPITKSRKELHHPALLTQNPNKYSDTKSRLESNRAKFIEVCNSLHPNKTASVPNPSKYASYAFGRLKWCSIPKSGTTFLTRELRPTLKRKGEYKVETPKRFVLVREPYSRIVSAFFSKIVGHPAWWPSFGAKIVSRFRTLATSNSKRCGHDVTFQEFIKFFIYSYETHWYKNSHFLPMHMVCDLCDDIPEFIAKIETVKPDMEFILNSVNVTGDAGKSFIEVRHLAELFMSFKTKFQDCGSMCYMLNRFWWGQQATGLIANDLPLPIKGEECNHVTGKQLADMAWDAHMASVERIGFDYKRQKRNTSIELWQQVSMNDRLKVRNILSLDCQLFVYDCSPDLVFGKE